MGTVSGHHAPKHAHSAHDLIVAHSSPAEFVLEVVSQKSLEQLRTMANIFAASSLYTKLRADIAEARHLQAQQPQSPMSPQWGSNGFGAFEQNSGALGGTVQYSPSKPIRAAPVQFVSVPLPLCFPLPQSSSIIV
jgi:hypothetical protein